MSMPSKLARYEAEWKELDALVRRGGRRLGPEELSRLDVLYRRAVILLAQAETRTGDRQLREQLNALVARAHAVLYLPPRRGKATKVVSFLMTGFARSVARGGRFHLAAGLLLLFGIVLAWVAVARDPAAAYALMPEGEFRLPGASREQLLEVLRSGRESNEGSKFLFASFLFSHNFKVGLMALATGILAAVPTIFLIIYNGMVVGAFSATHHMQGIYAEYWAWILPHGITELLAITLFGGCGLWLGVTWLRPGWRSRSEALRHTGREVGLTCLGGGAMLILAAIIESYIRQSHLTTGLRLMLAGLTAIFWIVYFMRGRRMEKAATGDEGETAVVLDGRSGAAKAGSAA